MKNDSASSSIPNESITYTLAHCEAKIAEIARNFNQPESELREWVGILLLTKGTGIVDNLSSLRGNSSKLHKTVGKVAMAKHTHRKTRGKSTSASLVSTKKRPKGSKSIRAFWAKYTPEERSKIMQERYKNRKAA